MPQIENYGGLLHVNALAPAFHTLAGYFLCPNNTKPDIGKDCAPDLKKIRAA